MRTSIAAVVDASVWVSWLKPQDVNHNASEIWMNRYLSMGGRFTAPTLLLVEVAAAISRHTQQKFLSQEALRNLTDVPNMQLVSIDDALIKSSVDIAIQLQLRAGDTLYVAVAQEQNIPLVSWDKEQLDRASRIIPTYSPDTYPF